MLQKASVMACLNYLAFSGGTEENQEGHRSG